jgi:MFS family permease
MQIQKAKIVIDSKFARFGTVGAVGLGLAGLLFVMAGLCVTDLSGNWRDSIVFLLPGILLIVVPILLKVFWLNPKAKLFQDSAVAQAAVIDRKQEKSKPGYGGGIWDFLVLILNWISPTYNYYLIIQFEASKLKYRQGKVTLQIRVTEQVHDFYPPGSHVEIQYARNDPRIAKLQNHPQIFF